MKIKLLLISLICIIGGCTTQPFCSIGWFEIHSVEKTSNGRCMYTIECSKPVLSFCPQFYDECKYKVGDKLSLTLKKK